MTIRQHIGIAGAALAATLACVPRAHAGGYYAAHREVSDVSAAQYPAGFTQYFDQALEVPWGQAVTHNPCRQYGALSCYSGTGPLLPVPAGTSNADAALIVSEQIDAARVLWVAGNGSGLVTAFDDAGEVLVNGALPLVFNVPGSPTGLVYNTACEPVITPGATTLAYASPCNHASAAATGDFDVSAGGKIAPSFLIVVTRQGKVYGWNPDVDAASAHLLLDNSAAGDDYMGAALDPAGGRLYLADFRHARVVAYDGQLHPLSFVGPSSQPVAALDDPGKPAGFAPTNLAFVNGQLIVTYAGQTAPGSAFELCGPTAPTTFTATFGHVAAFTLHADGTYAVQPLAAPVGRLNAPWGIALAPTSFGPYSSALYVGNFADGYINAFDPVTLQYLGRLGEQINGSAVQSQAISLPGLRGLDFKKMLSQGPSTSVPMKLWWANRLFYNANLLYTSNSPAAEWSIFGYIAPN
jgi:uncharacterized protein (TIGR03118 family)